MTGGIIKKTIEEAYKSNYYPYKIGAVIFKGSKIISFGHNDIRMCSKIKPQYKKVYNSLHAEQSAIRKVNWSKLKNCSILVIRIGRNGDFLMAKPCRYCRETIQHVKIKDIFYSNRYGEIVKEKV